MLYHTHLIRALDEQREAFARFDQTWHRDLSDYAGQLERLSSKPSEEIRSLATSRSKAPGALPSEEFDETGSARIIFAGRWGSHEEARRWAIDVLRSRTTFAVDGSQFLPGREVSIPTAAVQIATFENPHTAEGTYHKQARLFVITPSDLLGTEGGSSPRRHSSEADTIVSFRRFEEEIKALKEFLEKQRGWRARGEAIPVAFFDGTLLISYARPRTPVQDNYINLIIDLVKLSRDSEVPIVGFIDQSYARDLINLLDVLSGSAKSSVIYDAQVLLEQFANKGEAAAATTSSASGPTWGDRTSFCYCLREGLKDGFLDEQGDPLVGFSYLQTTGDNPPARLDLPSWIYEAGLLNSVLDVVRAECVVGNGYPYPIEAADAAAVITMRDRASFLRAVQEFAERERFGFRISRKTTSKLRRR